MENSRIEIRNGKRCRVDVMRRDAAGNVIAEFVQPLDDEPQSLIHNGPQDSRFVRADNQSDDLSGLPVLEPPTYQNKTNSSDGEVAYSNGCPVLEPPRWKPREDRAVKNDPRKSSNETDDDGLPILRTPGDRR